MIKSNTKKVKERIRNLIINNYDGSGYDPGTPETSATTFEQIARVVLSDVKRVKGYEVTKYHRYTWQEAFADWLQGLPGLLDMEYLYSASAIDLLGDILEETESEKARFDECQAIDYLNKLLYRELSAVAFDVFYNREV